MMILASFFSLLLAQVPAPTPVPVQDEIQIIDGKPVREIPNKHQHIDLTGATIHAGPMKAPVGIAVTSRPAEPFEKLVPDKKDFAKELRKSLD